MGQCPDEASKTIKTPDDRDQYCRIAMDYMMLTQRALMSKEARDESDAAREAGGGVPEDRQRKAITTLVIKDFSGEAVLTYPVRSKGLLRDQWLVPQIIDDLDALGLNGHMLAVECDQTDEARINMEETFTR